jgi:hypothetical protein
VTALRPTIAVGPFKMERVGDTIVIVDGREALLATLHSEHAYHDAPILVARMNDEDRETTEAIDQISRLLDNHGIDNLDDLEAWITELNDRPTVDDLTEVQDKLTEAETTLKEREDYNTIVDELYDARLRIEELTKDLDTHEDRAGKLERVERELALAEQAVAFLRHADAARWSVTIALEQLLAGLVLDDATRRAAIRRAAAHLVENGCVSPQIAALLALGEPEDT